MDSRRDRETLSTAARWVLRLLARLRTMPGSGARAADLHSRLLARWSGTAALRSVRTTLSWPPRLVPERIFVTSARRDDETRPTARMSGAVVRETAQSPRLRPAPVSFQPIPLFARAPMPVSAASVATASQRHVNSQPVMVTATASPVRERSSIVRAARHAAPDAELHAWPHRSRSTQEGGEARTQVDSTQILLRQAVLVHGPMPAAQQSEQERPSPRSRAAEESPAVRRQAAVPAMEQRARVSRGTDLYSRLPIPAGLGRHGFEWLSSASRGVRLHTDSGADRIARGLNADAVAWGEHIFVRDGRFDPATPEGLALISHELVHVIQHRNAVGVAASAAAPLVGNHHEREALAVERTVLAVMRPQTGGSPAAVPASPRHIASPGATTVVAPSVISATPFRAGEERSVEPASAQGPATDPAELAKEVYKLFERRLRVERERVGVRRT